MTEEKFAEEWVEKEYDELKYEKCERKDFIFTYYELKEMGKQAYLAGLKVGKDMNVPSKWHDLRVNPDDLPEESGCYLCILWSKVGGASFYDVCRYIFDYKEWGNSVDVIAWCELPEFKE